MNEKVMKIIREDRRRFIRNCATDGKRMACEVKIIFLYCQNAGTFAKFAEKLI